MPTAYDELAYPAYSHPQCHPNRLATIASLMGVPAAPIDHCRVLELGCGDGLDSIAIAYAWPKSHCVGIDLSTDAIARGTSLVDRLQLKNVHLHARDLTEAGEDLGRFDYILAHGLYSWVAPPVRDAALALCARLLSDSG